MSDTQMPDAPRDNRARRMMRPTLHNESSNGSIVIAWSDKGR
jgi:hypothetical protein